MSKYAGWENFDPVEHTAARVPTPKRKYHNQPTDVDGIRFDSKREAYRYQLLKLRQAAGEITDLKLQPRFSLSVFGGVISVIGEYRADFSYHEKGVLVVEDSKGVRTELYKWKRKHVKAEYGITIVEV